MGIGVVGSNAQRSLVVREGLDAIPALIVQIGEIKMRQRILRVGFERLVVVGNPRPGEPRADRLAEK